MRAGYGMWSVLQDVSTVIAAGAVSGKSGLPVSEAVLGTMSFGDDSPPPMLVGATGPQMTPR